MATRKQTTRKATATAAATSPPKTSRPPALIDTRCFRCGRPVVGDLAAGVLVDQGQSEHACAADG